jgi:hypothetical protein
MEASFHGLNSQRGTYPATGDDRGLRRGVEEFLTASSGEGSFFLPSPRWRGMRASLAPITTTPRTENAPAALAMMTVPPADAAPRSETGLPFE